MTAGQSVGIGGRVWNTKLTKYTNRNFASKQIFVFFVAFRMVIDSHGSEGCQPTLTQR